MRAILYVLISFLLISTLATFAIIPSKRGIKPPKDFSEAAKRIGQNYRSGGLYWAIYNKKYGYRATQPSVVLPVILGGYSNGPFGTYTKTQFQNLLFGSNPTGSMTDYYSEVSYGQLDISGTLYGWFYSTQTQVFYAGNNNGLSGGGARFCYDMAVLTDISIEFDQFDNDGPDGIPNSGDDDGYVDAFVAVHTGGGAETGDGDNIWSHQWDFTSAYLAFPGIMPDSVYVTNDASANGGFIKIKKYIVAPETADDGSPGDPMIAIGVFCHEFGHILGLPDLYDTSDPADSYGIGIWGLMGSGGYGSPDFNHPESPTHLSAWSKLDLGWISPTVIISNLSDVTINNVEDSPQVYLLQNNGIPGQEYFLVENRQSVGFDQYLPGGGLCIWHIDETVIDANRNSNTVNADEAHKGVDLEEADGRDDLDTEQNFGDDSDIFPGSSNRRVFSKYTYPNSNYYFGNLTDIKVASISNSGLIMSADLFVQPAAPGPASDIVAAEYFFDSDPGFGNGTPVSVLPDSVITVQLNIDVSGLPSGLHKLYIRAQDENGKWGIAQPRLVLIQLTNIATPTPDVTEAEYFFNSDPGFGNGNSFNFFPGDSISVTSNIDVFGLNPGLHKLYIRAKDETGKWGVAQPRLAMIQLTNPGTPRPDLTAAEYFFDSDPGFGNGTDFSFSPDDSISIASSLNVSALTPGLHKLYIRAKDESGKWGIAQPRLSLIQLMNSETPLPVLTRAEYFFDADPGFGNAAQFTVTPGDTIEINTILPIGGLGTGAHKIYIRTRDENRLWSIAHSDTFTKTTTCTPGLLGDITGDGATNSTDGLVLLSYDAGFPLPQPFLDRIAIGFGDVNADNLTNSTDALITLSWEAGFPVPFPVGDPVCLPAPAHETLRATSLPPAPGVRLNKTGATIRALANPQLLAGQTIEIPVVVDMGSLQEQLGSYTVALQWNPAVLQFESYRGGSAAGFDNPVVNTTATANGKLIAAHACPQGAGGTVNILNLQFKVVGTPGADPGLSLKFTALAAARTFSDLLPYLQLSESLLTVEELPTEYAIANYPNPFNASTEIHYQLPEAVKVEIVLFNVLGQKIRVLVNQRQEAGKYQLTWNGDSEQGQLLPSGIYFLRMRAGRFIADRKLLLLK